MRFMSKTSLCITGVVSLFLFTNLNIFSAVPWTDSDVVRYPLPMTIIGKVEILGNPAEADDVVAVLSGTEVVGLSSVVDVSGRKLVNLTMGINPKEKSFSIDSATGEFVFDPGDEEFTFKVWDKSTDTTYTAIQTPIPSAGKNLGDFAGRNFYSIAVKADINPTIVINTLPWNLTGFNVRLDNMSPSNVFQNMISQGRLKLIVAPKGDDFNPNFVGTGLEAFNEIVKLEDGVAYWVNSEQATSFSLSGREVDINTEIKLGIPWTPISCVLSTPIATDIALKELINRSDVAQSNLKRIAATSGDDFDPRFEGTALQVFNELSTLNGGVAYWVNVSNAQNFKFNTQ